MILTIRTDKPETELGVYDGEKQVLYKAWHADRNLSIELNKQIEGLLSSRQMSYGDLSGIVFFKGPGSFTGLRIGASVANTLAAELDISVAGANGETWIIKGIEALKAEPERRMVSLEYGEPPRTTKPRK